MDARVIMDSIKNQLGDQVILADKEQVLDMLYIAYANKQVDGWALKVFEKVFESMPVVFIPGTNPQAVSMGDTIDFITSIAASALTLSENVLENEGPVLADLKAEYDAAISCGAQNFQLTPMKEEIDYRQNMIDKSNLLLDLANAEIEKAEKLSANG